MRNGTHVGSLLPERAPSEGPRSTGAVEPITGVVPRERNKRACKEFWYLDLRLAAHMMAVSHLAELIPTDSES